MSTLIAGLERFGANEEGAQVVEYALIIAIVSIALVLALSGTGGIAGQFGAFVTRIASCFTASTC